MTSSLDLQLQLRLQAKRLEKESLKEEKNATKERNKAKAALQKGDRGFAQLYAQNAVKAEQLSRFLLEQSAKVSSIVADLKMADMQKTMAKQMETVVKDLEKSVGTLNLQNIAASTLKYDQLKGKVSQTNELTSPIPLDLEHESIDMLGDLENEIMAEMDLDIPLPDQPVAQKAKPQHAPGNPVGA